MKKCDNLRMVTGGDFICILDKGTSLKCAMGKEAPSLIMRQCYVNKAEERKAKLDKINSKINDK